MKLCFGSKRAFFAAALAQGLLYQLAFWSLFSALQQPEFYGWLAPETGMSYAAQPDGLRRVVHEPFRAVNWANLSSWDGEHYHRIAFQGYRCPDGGDCLSPHHAFFPLAPWFWALFRMGPVLALVFNWTCFAAGWAVLVWCIRGGGRVSLLVFGVGLLLPPAYVFMLPYSEGVYFGCGAVAVVGLLRRHLGLYALGACLLAMARPTLFLVVPALGGAAYLAWLRAPDLRRTLRLGVRYAAPLLAGTALVVVAQYVATGRWFLFYQAHHHYWKRDFSWPTSFTDWSHEGYGMSVVALGFGVWVVGTLLFHRLAQAQYSKELGLGPTTPSDWLIDWALLLAAASLLFVLATQGGLLAGLNRYLVATPFTFALGLVLASWVERKQLARLVFGGLALSLVLFERIEYGNFSLLKPESLWHLPLLGGGLLGGLMLLGAAWLAQPRLRWLWLALGLPLVPLLVFWHTYLLNCLLCNGWIVT